MRLLAVVSCDNQLGYASAIACEKALVRDRKSNQWQSCERWVVEHTLSPNL